MPEGQRRRFLDRLLGSEEIQPLDVDGVGVMAVGTAAWAVALLVLLPFHDRLQARGDGWWLWTCLAGVGLGLFGIAYCLKRARG